MKEKILCPECKGWSIKFGAFKSLDKKTRTQRYKCTKCENLFSNHAEHPFFKGARLPVSMIDAAIKQYMQGDLIKDIAADLKIRPNTVIHWVKKMKADPPKYGKYLVSRSSHTDEDKILINSIYEQFRPKRNLKRYQDLRSFSHSRKLPHKHL